LLTGDEKTQLEEKIERIESQAAVVISDYDDNLSNVEKRKELEAQFSSESKEFKRIALKLAKDQIASEKLEMQNR